MRDWMMAAALAGLALAATPAHAADALECMDEGHTAEQEAIFADFFTQFDPATYASQQDNSSDALVAPISSRAASCAVQHGWGQDALYHAILFRMSVLLAAAFEVKTPLTSEEMAKLEEALANADQEKLRRIFGPGIEASLAGTPEPAISEEDELYLGLVVIGSGLPMEDAIAEYAGGLLGARMMADIVAEKFAAM